MLSNEAMIYFFLNSTVGGATPLPLDTVMQNIANDLKTGTVPIVKSVQRGRTTSTTISISTVNPNKCVVILNGELSCVTISGVVKDVYTPSLVSITSTTLTITANSYSSGPTVYSSWQVVEFY